MPVPNMGKILFILYVGIKNTTKAARKNRQNGKNKALMVERALSPQKTPIATVVPILAYRPVIVIGTKITQKLFPAPVCTEANGDTTIEKED